MPGRSRKTRSVSIKKTPPGIKNTSPLEEGWPPAWCVSFSDLTTLLMSGFVLWYALTAIKIPADLLSIQATQRIAPEDVEFLKRETRTDETQFTKMVTNVKKLSTRQQQAIQEFKGLRTFKEELAAYVKDSGLADKVDVDVGTDAVMVTPRDLLLFPPGDARLSQSAFGLLDKIVDIVKTFDYYSIRIEGHTDPRSINPFRRYKYPTNWELSSARAIAVAQYMISKGIPPGSLSVAGYGEYKPRFSNETEEGISKNRRVDIYISLVKPKDQADKSL